MLDTVIKKLAIVLVLCGGIACLLYFTDIGDLINGEAKKKVEQFKKDTEKKIEAKKEEVKKAVEDKKEEVEDKVKSNVDKVEDKAKDLKKLKLKDIIK
jgi:gas vesicle protein